MVSSSSEDQECGWCGIFDDVDRSHVCVDTQSGVAEVMVLHERWLSGGRVIRFAMMLHSSSCGSISDEGGFNKNKF